MESDEPALLSKQPLPQLLQPYGCGSKLNHQDHQGTADFSPWFHLPGFYFGYPFLTHSHVAMSELMTAICDWFLPMSAAVVLRGMMAAWLHQKRSPTLRLLAPLGSGLGQYGRRPKCLRWLGRSESWHDLTCGSVKCLRLGQNVKGCD